MTFLISLFLLRRLLGRYTPARVTGSLPEGGLILAGNHPTILDGLVVGTFTPRRVRFLINADMLRIPLLGRWLRALGFLPARALEEAAAALARGECVAIFPEGHNTHRYELREFRRGVGVLSELSGAPVVPFGLRGTEELCPGDARYVLGGPIELSFGAPFLPSGGVEERRDQVREAVALQLAATPTPAGRASRLLALVVVPVTWALLKLADRGGFKGRR